MNMNDLLNDLNGREAIKLEELIGTSLQNIDEASAIKLMYAVAFTMKRREQAGIKWDDVLEMKLTEVNEYLGINTEETEEDPKVA